MRSSYIENKYGELLYSMCLIYKPKVVYEFGCLDGYSSSFFLKAMNQYESTKLKIYDLFEGYAYNHGNYPDVYDKLGTFKDKVQLEINKGDIFSSSIVNSIPNYSIEFIHIDISNDGEKLKNLFSLYSSKFNKKCIILLEGGSTERDRVDWMMEYNKPKIKDFLSGIKNEYNFFTFDPFPSVTVMQKC